MTTLHKCIKLKKLTNCKSTGFYSYLCELSLCSSLSGSPSGRSSSLSSSCSVVLWVSVTIRPSGRTELSSRVSSVSVTLLLRDDSWITRGPVDTTVRSPSFLRSTWRRSGWPLLTAARNSWNEKRKSEWVD